MASYVERDGDWVWRAPGNLEQASFFIFVLEAGNSELTQVCDKFINTPTASAVQAVPRFPTHPFVLLVCVDIKRGYSAHPGDVTKGYMTERDVGIFVPISFTDANGQASTAMLLPYLFVDNMAAVLIGREIFGFPKLLGDIRFLQDPPYIELKSTVCPVFDTDRIVVERPIIEVRRTAQSTIPPVGGAGAIVTITSLVLAKVLADIGVGAAAASAFTEVAMVFLKQFRDVQTDGQACHQSVSRAKASIDALRGAFVHFDTFEIRIRRHESINIASTLGLVDINGAVGTGRLFTPLAAVSADLDFSLPLGTTEWVAP